MKGYGGEKTFWNSPQEQTREKQMPLNFGKSLTSRTSYYRGLKFRFLIRGQAAAPEDSPAVFEPPAPLYLINLYQLIFSNHDRRVSGRAWCAVVWGNVRLATYSSMAYNVKT